MSLSAHLGREVKKLHPGTYDHHEDEILGRALQARFPGVYGSHLPDHDANTTPEAPRTLQIQLSQLKAGKRRAVFVARGSRADIIARNYDARKLPTSAGDFYYKPDLITAPEIISALRNHTLNEILGDVNKGYGAPDKTDLKGPVEAVVARDKEGETANSALTDKAHQQPAIEAAQQLTPQGGSVSVESPAKELQHRASAEPGNKPPAESPDMVDMPDSSVMGKPLKVKRPGGRGGRWPKA